MDVFEYSILPLLAEYFFDDWRKICLVLGENLERQLLEDIIVKQILSSEEAVLLSGQGRESEEPTILYDVADRSTWTIDHFRKIALRAS